MTRVILRFSINYEKNSALRNHVAGILTGAGLKNTGTGTWEANAVNAGVFGALHQALQAFENPQGVGAAAGVTVDHIWLYMD